MGLGPGLDRVLAGSWEKLGRGASGPLASSGNERLGPPGAVWGRLGPPGAAWGHLALSGAAWDRLAGTVWALLALSWAI